MGGGFRNIKPATSCPTDLRLAHYENVPVGDVEFFFRIHTAVMAAAYSARKLKSSAAQASHVGRKPYRAARSKVTGDAA
jgi:hypothetical protein